MAAEKIRSACPVNVFISAAVSASQSLAVPSQLLVSTRVPSDENTAEATWAVCPVKVQMRAPVPTSQSFAVLSQLPVRLFSVPRKGDGNDVPGMSFERAEQRAAGCVPKFLPPE